MEFDAQRFFEPSIAKTALFVLVSFLLIAFFAYDLYCPVKTPPNQFASECIFYFNGYWRIIAFVAGSYLISAGIVSAYAYLTKSEVP